MLTSTSLALTLFGLAPLVSAHGFIKDVTVRGQKTKAQKTDIRQSSFRSVSDNTGWIGSNFLGSDCAVCGCSETPFNRVAAPSGKTFSNAGQSAGKTPSISAGDSLTLHVAGNPGEGWPHPNGHMQAYLGAVEDTQNLDVKNVDFFKIQGIKDGIPALRNAFDRGSDSNPWNIQVPKAVKSGKYILRAELWAYGQSSEAEGRQVQFYPFCMNLEVENGGDANPATVRFPAEYANDKKIVGEGRSHLPGPEINAAFGGSGTGTGNGDKAAANKSDSPNNGSNNAGSSKSGETKKKSTGKKSSSGKKCSAPKKRDHRRHHARHAHHHAS